MIRFRVVHPQQQMFNLQRVTLLVAFLLYFVSLKWQSSPQPSVLPGSRKGVQGGKEGLLPLRAIMIDGCFTQGILKGAWGPHFGSFPFNLTGAHKNLCAQMRILSRTQSQGNGLWWLIGWDTVLGGTKQSCLTPQEATELATHLLNNNHLNVLWYETHHVLSRWTPVELSEPSLVQTMVCWREMVLEF